MSTTYTIKRNANVFLNKEGKPIFILNESTYDSNVFPQTPRISILHIGDLKSTMEKIFSYASYVEGGMLNSPNGNLTPEGYIKSWIECIKHPYHYDPDQQLDFDFYRVNPGLKSDLLLAIEERGAPKTVLENYDLATQFHSFSCIPKTFDSGCNPFVGFSEIGGYTPLKCHEAPQHPKNYIKLMHEYEPYYIEMNENGQGIGGPGWFYMVVSRYIGSLADQELSHPGSYKPRIQQFRKFLKALPATNLDDITCSIEPVTATDDEYKSKRKLEMIEKYGDGDFLFTALSSDDQYWVLHGPVIFTINDASKQMAEGSFVTKPNPLQAPLFL